MFIQVMVPFSSTEYSHINVSGLHEREMAISIRVLSGQAAICMEENASDDCFGTIKLFCSRDLISCAFSECLVDCMFLCSHVTVISTDEITVFNHVI